MFYGAYFRAQLVHGPITEIVDLDALAKRSQEEYQKYSKSVKIQERCFEVSDQL